MRSTISKARLTLGITTVPSAPASGCCGLYTGLAGSLVVGDAADVNRLSGTPPARCHEFVFEGDDLALVGAALGRAGRLGVRDVLGDDVEADLLGGESARGGFDAGDKVHAGDQAERPVMAIFSCLMFLETTSVRNSYSTAFLLIGEQLVLDLDGVAVRADAARVRVLHERGREIVTRAVELSRAACGP